MTVGGIIFTLIIIGILFPELFLIIFGIVVVFFEFILKLFGKSFFDKEDKDKKE
jgi:hypothetical protein